MAFNYMIRIFSIVFLGPLIFSCRESAIDNPHREEMSMMIISGKISTFYGDRVLEWDVSEQSLNFEIGKMVLAKIEDLKKLPPEATYKRNDRVAYVSADYINVRDGVDRLVACFPGTALIRDDDVYKEYHDGKMYSALEKLIINGAIISTTKELPQSDSDLPPPQ